MGSLTREERRYLIAFIIVVCFIRGFTRYCDKEYARGDERGGVYAVGSRLSVKLDTYGADTVSDLRSVENDLAVGNQSGIQVMISNGKVIRLNAGTVVEVASTEGNAVSDVRVLSGPFEGQTINVARETLGRVYDSRPKG